MREQKLDWFLCSALLTKASYSPVAEADDVNIPVVEGWWRKWKGALPMRVA